MDDLDKQRQALADAIASLKAYKGTAGSDSMQAVQSALDYAGWAYACIDTTSNPAWTS